MADYPNSNYIEGNSPGGSGGTIYNTLTLTAITTAGATDTTDTSTLNYFVIN
jgi:hypothetical protein